ncbi:MAG: hypothetical protein KAF91_06930 [Nostoc sp. TH1S01]|nr:hypothetical protein [Nostoc sp. TH1S01]
MTVLPFSFCLCDRTFDDAVDLGDVWRQAALRLRTLRNCIRLAIASGNGVVAIALRGIKI